MLAGGSEKDLMYQGDKQQVKDSIPPQVLLVGVSEEKARLLQWLNFFVSSTRSVHFLCIVHFDHKYLVLDFERFVRHFFENFLMSQKVSLQFFDIWQQWVLKILKGSPSHFSAP